MRGGSGADRRRPFSAVAWHWELAGLRCFGVPGLKTEWAWVRKGLRDMRSPLEAFAGRGEVRGGVCYDGDGPARRGSPARGVQAAGVRYRLKQSSVKAWRGIEGAHRGLKRPGA